MAHSGTQTKKKRTGWFRPKKRKSHSGEATPSALDYIEEAIHTLRCVPLTTFLPYCIGTFPFIIAFFLFWNDMAHSALAERILPLSSLGLAILFVWMKCWQSIFTYQIHCFVSRKQSHRLTIKQWLTLIQRQASWQATGFITLAPALLLTLPFARVFAFYQNITALDIRETEVGQSFGQRAFKQATLWPNQGNMLTLIFFFLGGFTLLSWYVVIATIPYLARTLLGYQSILANSDFNVFIVTLTPIAFAFTYISIDPIIKTVYTLRCYYGESRKNGEDLLAALEDFRANLLQHTHTFALIAIIFGCALAPSVARAQPSTAPVSSAPEEGDNNEPAGEFAIAPETLNNSINQTLSQREYTWRISPADADTVDFEQYTWLQRLQELADDFRAWLKEKLKKQESNHQISGPSLIDLRTSIEFIAYLALLILAVIIILFAIRFIRNWPSGLPSNAAVPLDEALPDLDNEDVTADSLSLSRWVLYAKELLAKGSYRLAMRAYFLAQLAHFSDQGLISIHKFKSNRDYYHELAKRNHSATNLLHIYQHQVVLFESIWYGEHAVDMQDIQHMEDFLTQLGVVLEETSNIEH